MTFIPLFSRRALAAILIALFTLLAVGLGFDAAANRPLPADASPAAAAPAPHRPHPASAPASGPASAPDNPPMYLGE